MAAVFFHPHNHNDQNQSRGGAFGNFERMKQQEAEFAST
jgi:hypothetical protein